MVMYNYKCDKCEYTFSQNCKVSERNQIIGSQCPECNDGRIIRSYNIPNFTFDMNKKCPSDLKLVIDRMKDKAKLNSIVDEGDCLDD